MTYGQTESTVNLYFSLVDQVENYKFSLSSKCSALNRQHVTCGQG